MTGLYKYEQSFCQQRRHRLVYRVALDGLKYLGGPAEKNVAELLARNRNGKNSHLTRFLRKFCVTARSS